MSDKKNIERLFQERFKDFEVNPAPEVWGNIKSKLEKKENKRRIVPFWFNAKATGIAAALVLGFFGLNNYVNWNLFSNDNVIDSKEIPTDHSSTYYQNETKKHQNSTIKSPTENLVSNHHEAIANQSNFTTDSSKKAKQSNLTNAAYSSSTQRLVSSSKNKSEQIKSSQNTTAFPSSRYSENPISNTNKQPSKSNNVISAEQNSKGITNHVIEKGVAVSDVEANKNAISNTNKQPSKSNDVISAEQSSKGITNRVIKKGVAVSDVEANKNAISNINKQPSKSNDVISVEQSSKGITNRVIEKGVAVSDVEANKNAISNTNKQLSKVNDVISSEQNSKEILSPVLGKKSNQNPIVSTNTLPINDSDVIVSKENSVKTANQIAISKEVIAKDSIKIAVVEENALEKILKDKELVEKEDEKLTQVAERWKVRPNVAPIFMNSSKGSPIDGQFSDNSKKFDNSMSLGLGVDYAVTSKISVRTGVSKFELGYDTNEIVYYKDLSSKGIHTKNLKTIKVRPEMEGLVIEDKKVSQSQSQSQELAFQNKDDGYLNQQMSYMEVPVEVSYKLLDRKFGIQFITGVSTLFLSDNKVSVISNGRSTTVGEANNLNKVHFSTNIGIGFKYSFWKSFEANFEPTFKYQINTFNENSGGFKPYIIGLYSGLSFKF